MSIKESDIIDIDVPGEKTSQPLTCPFCSHTSTFHAPVKYDEKAECYVCFKCGKEWTIAKGKPKELK